MIYTTYCKYLKSWLSEDSIFNSTEELIQWVNERNNNTHVSINKTLLSKMDNWYYDKEKGMIRHSSGKFFTIEGVRITDDKGILLEQPIINQNEIGFLGIITKEFDGIMYFLMQAKIEPGNVNKIQISPTVQATRSNFSQVHKGKRPKYIEYFINAASHEIIVDQLQSEQSSRFIKKRNRNIIIKVDDIVEPSQNFRWMTLKQIKELLKIDNLVNMDTRTVLSCLPFNMYMNNFTDIQIKDLKKSVNNSALYESLITKDEITSFQEVYNKINDSKMFHNHILNRVNLHEMKTWDFSDNEISGAEISDFKVIFCDVEIEGREIIKWTQPLFEAKGIALFGFIIKKINEKVHFLVKLKKEIGCFDIIELGPTVQMECTELNKKDNMDYVTQLFFKNLRNKKNILYDVVLSEEGGRFYHEQNRNIIIEIKDNIIIENDYIWLNYGQLNFLNQFNNILNIQARNLLSLVEV